MSGYTLANFYQSNGCPAATQLLDLTMTYANMPESIHPIQAIWGTWNRKQVGQKL